MVQMKDPNTFEIDAPTIILYIPHGSDESHYIDLPRVLCKRLYIPHGSDERRIFEINSSGVIAFISHMVQMKDHSYLSCCF